MTAVENISVVMVSYFTGPALFSALDSTLSQVGLRELILVDNGNPIEVMNRLEDMASRHPKLQIISGQGNVGFARGCNLGASRSSGEYLLLLNPDCILPENTLATAVGEFTSYPHAMLAGANIVHPDGSPQRGSRRELLTPRNACLESLFLTRFCRDRFNFHTEAMPEKTVEIPAISGAFMLMRKEDFTKLGGLDEGYFLHVEDMDLCMRVSKAGGKTIFMPDVKVLHFLSTSGASSYIVEWHKTKGFLRYFSRFYSEQLGTFRMTLLKVAIYARFMLKCGKIMIHQLVRRK